MVQEMGGGKRRTQLIFTGTRRVKLRPVLRLTLGQIGRLVHLLYITVQRPIWLSVASLKPTVRELRTEASVFLSANNFRLHISPQDF